MVRRVLVVVLLVLCGAGRGEAMFGNTGAALYGEPVISWGDFARTHVALFTDQDCVSYVYHRILARIQKDKHNNKNKNNGGAGVRSLP